MSDLPVRSNVSPRSVMRPILLGQTIGCDALLFELFGRRDYFER